MARQFFSPNDTGLYMSLVLRPSPTISPLLITTAAAVAVAQAIEQVAGETAQIKWVNDVYCRGKKVCGILTEGAYSGDTLVYAILGIGLNVSEPKNGFPPELQQRAGAVFYADFAPFENAAERIAKEIITRFWAFYEALPSVYNCLLEYRGRDMLRGRTVEVLDIHGAVIREATASGIGDDFSLLVTDENSEQTALTSGEVSIRL